MQVNVHLKIGFNGLRDQRIILSTKERYMVLKQPSLYKAYRKGYKQRVYCINKANTLSWQAKLV